LLQRLVLLTFMALPVTNVIFSCRKASFVSEDESGVADSASVTAEILMRMSIDSHCLCMCLPFAQHHRGKLMNDTITTVKWQTFSLRFSHAK